ncbi:MAG: N-acetylmuramoyl-L-alanine amidase, partial [Chloroflexi bacterium]|nr:N-acetylmuramoyl-L-alanine amidase [Chloroflexota bacterium]
MKIVERFDPATEWDERRGDGNWNNDSGRAVLGVAMHKTGFKSDTAEGVVRWFQNRQSRVSAHYVVGQDGLIYRVVPEEYVAYATGGSP